jgi:hypothetical protein
MSGHHIGVEAVFVTPFADLGSNRAVAPSCLRERQGSPEEERKGKNGKDQQESSHDDPLYFEFRNGSPEGFRRVSLRAA